LSHFLLHSSPHETSCACKTCRAQACAYEGSGAPVAFTARQSAQARTDASTYSDAF
jgi:hypothetical protein